MFCLHTPVGPKLLASIDTSEPVVAMDTHRDTEADSHSDRHTHSTEHIHAHTHTPRQQAFPTSNYVLYRETDS